MSPDHAPLPDRLRRRALLLTVLGSLLALSLLGGAAWLLAESQRTEREQLRARYANGATVASALVDSLFFVAFRNTTQRAITQFSGEVTSEMVEEYAKLNRSAYVAVLDDDGTILAATSSAPASFRDTFLDAARTEDGYAVGDVERRGAKEVVPSVVRFPAGQETRFLVTGAPLPIYRGFLGGSIGPLVKLGGDAYVLDGNGRTLGAVSSSSPDRPPPPSDTLVGLARRTGSDEYRKGDQDRFYASEAVPATTWHVAVTAPTRELYEPTAGTGRWLPWLVLGFLGLALTAIVVLMRRALLASARIAAFNHELEVSNAELHRSNAELEQFAYVASHDLSAPLRAVAGFSQLLGSRYKGRLDADADEFIHHMQQGVDRMQRIIDDLLAYSRVGRGGLAAEPVDLDAVLDEVLGGLSADITARDAVVSREPLGRVSGEPGQLSQVLQNLVSNAMKFTAPGVRPEVHVSCRREGGRVHVAVRDNGIGIDPDQAEQIFRMFQRLHGEEDFEGTGIGLAIAQKIIERHGGTIVVSPAPGGGTVFTFDVPDRAA